MKHYMNLPKLGDDIESGKVLSIKVTAGDALIQGQTILEIETDKVVLEIPTDLAGEVVELHISEGDIISPGVLVLELDVKEDKVSSHALDTSSDATTKTISDEEMLLQKKNETQTIYPAGPGARRLAREIGVKLSEINRSATQGHITKADVNAFVKSQNDSRIVSNTSHEIATKILPDLTKYGTVRKEKMSGIELATAANMQHIWDQVPHAWLQEKIDITELEKARQKHKLQVQQNGGALTLTTILVGVVARVLMKFPRLNSALDSNENEIIYRDYFHIGVAIDTPAGLVVPKVENANNKGFNQLSQELKELAEKAHTRKLSTNELNGAGFTISNLGGIGMCSILPLVNWPQVAILGVASSQIEPLFIDGEFQPRLMMPVSLGFDHRVINGAEGAKFLKQLKSMLEDPFSLLL